MKIQFVLCNIGGAQRARQRPTTQYRGTPRLTSHRVRVFLFASIILATAACEKAAGSDGGWLGDGLARQLGPSCPGDPEQLADLLVTPQPCAASSQCPIGSHCNLELGVCDWECMVDADCGTGETCSCEGRCSVGGAGGSGGSQPDASCPKNLALLKTQSTPTSCSTDGDCVFGTTCDPSSGACAWRQACILDEDCPEGAFCDAVTGLCAWECLEGHVDCAPGSVCDCFGRCVTGDEPAPQPPGFAPRLVVTPLHAEVEITGAGPTWESQAFQIDVVFEDPARATKPSRARISVGPELRVLDCGLPPAVNDLQDCDLTSDDWGVPVATADGGVKYTVTKGVKPIVGTLAESAPWPIVVRVAGAANPRETVTLDAKPAPVSQSLDGEYFGVLRRADAETGVAGFAHPVSAWVSGQRAVIFDGTRSLTSADKFVVRLDSTTAYGTTWLAPSGDLGAGEIVVDVARGPDAFAFDAVSGLLEGSILTTLPFAEPSGVSIEWRLELNRVADLSAQTCAGVCPESTACVPELSLCAPGDAFSFGPARYNNIYSMHDSQWQAAATAVIERVASQMSFLPNIYGARGFSRHAAASKGVYGRHTAAMTDAEIGYALCERDFAPLLSTPGTSLMHCSDDADAAHLCAVMGPDRRIEPACKPASVDACESIYAAKIDIITDCVDPSTEQLADRKRNLVPCIENGFASHADLGDLSCASVFLASTDPGGNVATWIDSNCIRTFYLLEAFQAGFGPEPGGPVRTEVYLCPFRPALLTPGSWVDADLDTWCFDPAQNPDDDPLDMAAWEDSFGSSFARVSGDFLCDGLYLDEERELRPSSTAPLYSARDTSDLTGEPTPSNARMLRDCIQDLERLPPPGYDDFTPGQASAIIRTVFGTEGCISPGRFFRARNQAHLAGSQRRYARLQQQWLGVLSFVARGAAEERNVASGLLYYEDLDPDIERSLSAAPELLDAMKILERGWPVLLGGGASGYLEGRHGDVWRFPDYRETPPAATPEHEMTKALPVSMLDAMTSHLVLAKAFAMEAMARDYERCLGGSPSEAIAEIGGVLRTSLLVEALAAHMYGKAAYFPCAVDADCSQAQPGSICLEEIGSCAVEGPPGGPDFVTVPFEPLASEWKRAQSELSAIRDDLLRQSASLASCANPINVSEEDLPLFFGDPMGTSARFFASSDYLVDVWAAPAIATSQAALDSARDAWLAARDREIQQRMTDRDAERRVEAIRVSYGQRLKDLCGITGTDAVDVLSRFEPEGADPIDPYACHVAEIPLCNRVDAIEDYRCLEGRIGQAAQEVLLAKEEVETARVGLSEHLEAYMLRTESCIDLQVMLAEENGIIQAYAAEMRRLILLKVEADKAAEKFTFQGSLLTLDPVGMAASMYAGQAGPHRLASIGLAAEMELVELNYRTTMTLRANQREVMRCFDEADLSMVGVASAQRRISDSLLRADVATSRYMELRRSVPTVIAEGLSSIARETGRTVPNVGHDHWIHEKVETFQRRFGWAKRLTYLAMRATEYDFQQSLGLRSEILMAAHPRELDSALALLQRERVGRTINRRRPEASILVRSLRDDILGLSARDAQVEATGGALPLRRLDAVERFMNRYSADQYAVFDADDAYLGQGIPFTLSDENVVSHRCAERLWRVSATVQGDILDQDAPAVPLLLLKGNTFHSRWCEGLGDGNEYQTASIRPSSQLFEDAGAAETLETYTAAMITPRLNTPRGEFYAEAYAEGASEELAGRGLYGDYVLVFPHAGLLERGFDMSRVEDVLLRFDIISVDDVHTRE